MFDNFAREPFNESRPKLNIIYSKLNTMIWTDSLNIAIALDEAHPKINPTLINFVDLKKMVIDLDEFEDDEAKSGEKILEAIQMYWIEEKQ